MRSLDAIGPLLAVMLRVIRGCGVGAGGLLVVGVKPDASVCAPVSGVGCGLVGSPPGIAACCCGSGLADSPPGIGAWADGCGAIDLGVIGSCTAAIFVLWPSPVVGGVSVVLAGCCGMALSSSSSLSDDEYVGSRVMGG